MRLFTAILLPEAVKEELAQAAGIIRGLGGKGSFVPRENYHLTLCFLGETHREEAACQAVLETPVPRLTLQLAQPGLFRHPQGDVLMVGLARSEKLLALQRQLAHNLQIRGFSLKERAYIPHITLARRLSTPPGKLPEIRWSAQGIFPVEGISLMETRPVAAGGVTYSRRIFVRGTE